MRCGPQDQPEVLFSVLCVHLGNNHQGTLLLSLHLHEMEPSKSFGRAVAQVSIRQDASSHALLPGRENLRDRFSLSLGAALTLFPGLLSPCRTASLLPSKACPSVASPVSLVQIFVQDTKNWGRSPKDPAPRNSAASYLSLHVSTQILYPAWSRAQKSCMN